MSSTVDALQLLRSPQEAGQLLHLTRRADPEAALHTLAQSILNHDIWRSLPAQLVGRAAPEPLLAAFGHFSDTQRSELRALAEHVNYACSVFRYVDYRDAETAAQTLAERLLRRFGAQEIARFRYAAIPRGGLFVLGMLSYFLGLRRDQIVGLDPGCAADGDTLVVVDDCALSGVRLREVLSRLTEPEVVFCPLFAPDELCRAVEQREARVAACINAADLADTARDRFGNAYDQWRSIVEQHSSEGRYWTGYPQYIGFPWSSPETSYWNAASGRFEADWNVLPQGLRGRAVKLNEAETVDAQTAAPGRACGETLILQPEGPGPLCAGYHVLWTEIDNAVAVARFAPEPPTTEPLNGESTGSEPCFQLQGVAADMWRALLQHGTLEGAQAALQRQYDVAPQRLRADLAGFAAELEQTGLLRNDAAP